MVVDLIFLVCWNVEWFQTPQLEWNEPILYFFPQLAFGAAILNTQIPLLGNLVNRVARYMREHTGNYMSDEGTCSDVADLQISCPWSNFRVSNRRACCPVLWQSLWGCHRVQFSGRLFFIYQWCCSCCGRFPDPPLRRRHHSVYIWPFLGHCVKTSYGCRGTIE